MKYFSNIKMFLTGGAFLLESPFIFEFRVGDCFICCLEIEGEPVFCNIIVWFDLCWAGIWTVCAELEKESDREIELEEVGKGEGKEEWPFFLCLLGGGELADSDLEEDRVVKTWAVWGKWKREDEG